MEGLVVFTIKRIAVEDTRSQLQRIFSSTQWSDEDQRWLLDYLGQNETAELRQLLQQDFATWLDAQSPMDERAAALLAAIHRRIHAVEQPAKVVGIAWWKRMAAAAAVLLMVSTIAFFLFNKKGNEEGRMTQRQQQEFKSDIPPGGNKAVLTLQDNRVIVLNDAQNGTLAEQGGAQVVKLDDGQLAYHSGSHASSEISYNTISTPRGGQYQLTLNDGTKVWLNASSSLRFPAVFANQERRVEMTGEVYFEVARNASKPFRVNVAGKGEVEVLGTHFNINAYTDEPQVKATLLEGRVRITGSSTKQSLELLPGQQAQLGQSGQLTLNRQADTGEVMAWKNGKFSFGEGMEIEAVMRQLSRWYDVDIVYEDRVKGVLGGSMSRSVPASQVLDMLEMTGVVKFRMEGQKVIVMAR